MPAVRLSQKPSAYAPPPAVGAGMADSAAALREPTSHLGTLVGFDELVRDLGGDPNRILASVGISPDAVAHPSRNARIPCDRVMQALNVAAADLGRQDFGLQLASRQARYGFTGPVAIAMRNAVDLDAGFRILSERAYTYSDILHFTPFAEPSKNRLVLRVDILAGPQRDERQAVEHSLLTTHLITSLMSGGAAQTREVWMRHDPINPPGVYRDFFQANVQFSRPINAVVLAPEDARLPVVGRNGEVYELATSFIESHYSRPEEPLHEKTRRALRQRENLGEVTVSQIADMLGLHLRTFQRRLRDEGYRFEAIKDEVCQELALVYLRHTQLPLIRVANMLGYSEASAFSHRCRHWFGCSPRDLRRGGEAG